MENSENIAPANEINDHCNVEEEKQPTKKMNKSSFKYKKEENGIILTIHHTVKENNSIVRIRLVIGCFNETKKELVTIDNRGNIFIFNLANKKYWRPMERVLKPCVIRNIPNQPNEYLIGTKHGCICWLDVDKSKITRYEVYSNERISNISFPGIELTPSLAVVHSNHEALLLNLTTCEASHRLEFNQTKISLKYVSYIPLSDQIFTCFTNDSVHLWSGITLNTIRVHNPIRIRDRYLMSKEPHVILRLKVDDSNTNFEMNCDEVKDFSRGLINSFTFSADGSIVCFTTLDNYVICLSTVNFELLKLIKLEDFLLKGCWLFRKPNNFILLCQTFKSELVLIDIENSNIKLMVEDSNCFRVEASRDKELIYVIKTTGEANIYCVPTLMNYLISTQNCAKLLKSAMSQPKALPVDCLDSKLRKMLTRSQLLPILREYGQYPNKYRNLIWTALLDIPCNKAQFMELIKMGTHPTAVALKKSLKLKDMSVKQNLVKIFSCLAYWTKVFGYVDFLPTFIFPFVKTFGNSLNVCFEVIASVLTNQCQLWFEFHPLEPFNYLAICENMLAHFSPKLAKFYIDNDVTAKEYAWAILANAFSEVLDDEQWACLWDNILSNPPYFLLLCVVAYNIVQREKIMKITRKEDIAEFFHDQNAIDMKKFIKKAYHLMTECPEALHPAQYMKEFVKLPKGVYPQFQNYPKKWVEKQESELDAIRKGQQMIDAKIRQLEREDMQMMEKLQRGLQQEEHSKRMKAMEKEFQEILKREEERIAYQRKILLLYQKELRQKKGKVVELLNKSARRRKQNLQENELDTMMMDVERERKRNELDLLLAEENIKDQEFKLLAQKYGVDDIASGSDYQPMRHQFKDAIDKLAEEKKKLSVDLQSILRDTSDDDDVVSFSSLSKIESKIRALEKEFKSTLKC